MKNKGFTLVEILVVVAIISVLASVVYASTSGARDKAIDAKIQKMTTNLETEIELAKLDGLGSVTTVAASNPAISISNSGVVTSTDVPGASFDVRRGITNTNPENSLAEIIAAGIVPIPAAGDVFDELPKVSSKLNGGLDEDIYYISNGTQAIDSKGYEYICVDPEDLTSNSVTFNGPEYGPYDGYTWTYYTSSGFLALLTEEIPSEIYFTLARGDRTDNKRLIIRNYYYNWWLPHHSASDAEEHLPDLPLFQDWVYDADFNPKMPYYSDADLEQGNSIDERRLGVYTCT